MWFSWPTLKSIVSAAGFNKQSVNKFFDFLKNDIEENNVDTKQIFSVDECGVCIVQSK